MVLSLGVVGTGLVAILVLHGGGTNPIRMCFLAAAVNSVLAPPLVLLVMLVGSNPKIYDERSNGFCRTGSGERRS